MERRTKNYRTVRGGGSRAATSGRSSRIASRSARSASRSSRNSSRSGSTRAMQWSAQRGATPRRTLSVLSADSLIAMEDRFRRELRLAQEHVCNSFAQDSAIIQTEMRLAAAEGFVRTPPASSTTSIGRRVPKSFQKGNDPDQRSHQLNLEPEPEPEPEPVPEPRRGPKPGAHPVLGITEPTLAPRVVAETDLQPTAYQHETDKVDKEVVITGNKAPLQDYVSDATTDGSGSVAELKSKSEAAAPEEEKKAVQAEDELEEEEIEEGEDDGEKDEVVGDYDEHSSDCRLVQSSSSAAEASDSEQETNSRVVFSTSKLQKPKRKTTSTHGANAISSGSQWQQEKKEKLARQEEQKRQARIDQAWLDEQAQRVAEMAAADRLAKIQDDVRVMRDLWDGATSARASEAVLERGDFASAAGALHASISLGFSGGPGTSSLSAPSSASSIGVDEGGGSHALSTGVVPWLLFDPCFFGGKNSCSQYFRSVGKSASDPSAVGSPHLEGEMLHASVIAFLAQEVDGQSPPNTTGSRSLE